jgi:hypothetical protein
VVPAKGSQTPTTDDEPLMSFGTKAKILGGGALIGGGMLASQAIGAAGQVLSRPGSSYGGGYQGQRNVSAYGYPVN